MAQKEDIQVLDIQVLDSGLRSTNTSTDQDLDDGIYYIAVCPSKDAARQKPTTTTTCASTTKSNSEGKETFVVDSSSEEKEDIFVVDSSNIQVHACGIGYIQMTSNGSLSLMRGNDPGVNAKFECKTIQRAIFGRPKIFQLISVSYPQYYLTGHIIGNNPMTVDGIYVEETSKWSLEAVNKKNQIYKLRLAVKDVPPNESYFYVGEKQDDPYSIYFKLGRSQPVDQFQFKKA